MKNKMIVYAVLGLGAYFAWKKFSKPATIYVDSLDSPTPTIKSVIPGVFAGRG